MTTGKLLARLEILEQRVNVLETLPARVDALAEQIVQLRDDMLGAFSALRTETRAGDEETRESLRDEIRVGDEETRRQLRDEIRVGDEETRRQLRDEIRAGDEETRRQLRDEIRAGDEETRRQLRDEIRTGDEATQSLMRELVQETRAHMLVLHEDLVERIKRIGEAPSSSPPAGAEAGGAPRRTRAARRRS